MKKIGLTTTVPIEIFVAAGYTPVDLNNIFVTSKDYLKYIELAERDGFPKSICAWIKGLYGVCIANNINEIVGVIGGDCSNTKALADLLTYKGIKVYDFSYPQSHTKEDLEIELRKLMNLLNVDMVEVEKNRTEFNQVRALAHELDRLTYEELKVSGFENHLYLVNCSDFEGNANEYAKGLNTAIAEASLRKPMGKKLRLGYIGVPPMTADLYSFVEQFDASILYNEVQREFSFPRAAKAKDIFEQYHDYTYPYDSAFRIKEIKKQIKERKLDGLIHYTQAFCHRAIDDIIIKATIDLPILNIEGDQQNTLDARTKLRLEAYLDMLSDLKGAH
ncbi:MAG: 2-hydroxyglutaryl-CoA dehydratase [Firmicutes bacterium HGW-Firmicutes-7]|nr:MAG: 2-hydroxyglutaryl-CoA dehydratase [Firmicutes bacterium HGW-Firmicutes-7]